MKFVTFSRAGNAPEPGVLSGEQIISLTGAGYADLPSLFAFGGDAVARIASWVSNPPADALVNAASAKLLAPLPRPNKLI